MNQGHNALIDSALLYAERIKDDKIFAVQIYRDIANIMLAMELYSRADSIARQGLALLPSMFAKHHEAELYRIRTEALQAMQRIKEALSCYDQYRRCMEIIAKESVLVSIGDTEQDILDQDARHQLEQQVTYQRIAQTKTYYTFGAVIMCLLVGGVMMFVWYRTKKRLKARQEEDILREHYRKESLQALYLGQEIERRLIAKDIHDGLGATLSLAKLQLSSVSVELMSNDNRIIHNVLYTIDHAVEDIRRLARRLSSQLLTEYGLEIAMRDYVSLINEMMRPGHYHEKNNAMQSAQSLPMTIILKTEHCAGLRFSELIETSLFRVVQEIITNTLKHARAEYLHIDLVYYDATLVLTAKDTGIGFDTERTYTENLGLRNMRERIQSIEGTFDIDSTIGKGTCVVIRVPAPLLSSSP